MVNILKSTLSTPIQIFIKFHVNSQIIIDTKYFSKGNKYFCLGTQITSAAAHTPLYLFSFRSKYYFESLVKSLNASADDRLGGNIATIMHTSLSTNIHLMHQRTSIVLKLIELAAEYIFLV